MRLRHPQARLYFPNEGIHGVDLNATTHLGIGAHQDDLEILAAHGIVECFEPGPGAFTGVVVTDGVSTTGGEGDAAEQAEQARVRAEEQLEAARIGRYHACALLGYSSHRVKEGPPPDLVEDLVQIFRETRADIVYTHNFCDKHQTHLAVAWAVVCALRQLSADELPRRVIGCEVWRALDWLPDSKKIQLDVSAHPELQERLIAVFRSQIDAGKRYDLATMGRRRAHATFSESHSRDQASAVVYGMDLLPFVRAPELSVETFVEGLLEAFRADLVSPLKGLPFSF